jgi:hypothetical protein
MNSAVCPTCGGPLIQKNKKHLLLASVVFIGVGIGTLLLNNKLWPLAFFLWMISVYLIAWSWFAKGLWCRQCKSAPFKSLK